MAQQDPFPTALASLRETLSTLPGLVSSLRRITSTTTSQTSPEAAAARADLQNTLDDVSADLSDLTLSVEAAERQPSRFGLDAAEVARRRKAVDDVARDVAKLRREAAGAAPTDAGLPSPGAFDDAAFGGDGDGDGDEYEAWEQQRQEEMLAEQDEALEGVGETVGRLRMQADEMGRELEEQAVMLEDVDNVADRVGGKLQTGLKRVEWVIKKNEDTASSCCIAVLIVVLIILLIIVLTI